MRVMYDAATPPASFTAGEPWAGYLPSPTASAPWPDAKLIAAAHAGGLLPVYVAPLSRAGFKARHPAADAHLALAHLHRLGLEPTVIALDTDRWPGSSSVLLRRAILRYARAFAAACHAQGVVCAHYGSPDFLRAIGHRPGTLAWLADWTTDTHWPLTSWPAPRGWQYATNVAHAGTNTDVSRVDDTWPLCHPAKPHPPAPAVQHPSPADVAMAHASRSWLAERGL